jgi:hypothetical protein
MITNLSFEILKQLSQYTNINNLLITTKKFLFYKYELYIYNLNERYSLKYIYNSKFREKIDSKTKLVKIYNEEDINIISHLKNFDSLDIDIKDYNWKNGIVIENIKNINDFKIHGDGDDNYNYEVCDLFIQDIKNINNLDNTNYKKHYSCMPLIIHNLKNIKKFMFDVMCYHGYHYELYNLKNIDVIELWCWCCILYNLSNIGTIKVGDCTTYYDITLYDSDVDYVNASAPISKIVNCNINSLETGGSTCIDTCNIRDLEWDGFQYENGDARIINSNIDKCTLEGVEIYINNSVINDCIINGHIRNIKIVNTTIKKCLFDNDKGFRKNEGHIRNIKIVNTKMIFSNCDIGSVIIESCDINNMKILNFISKLYELVIDKCTNIDLLIEKINGDEITITESSNIYIKNFNSTHNIKIINCSYDNDNIIIDEFNNIVINKACIQIDNIKIEKCSNIYLCDCIDIIITKFWSNSKNPLQMYIHSPISIKKYILTNVQHHNKFYYELEHFKLFIANKCKFDSNLTMIAVLNNDIESLKIYHEMGCKLHSKICEKAARYGYIDCLKYGYESGILLTKKISENACKYGHIKCLRFARIYGPQLTLKNLRLAIKYNQIICIEYIKKHFQSIDKNYY